MVFLLAFVGALASTALAGAVAKLAIGLFAPDRAAGFAAFCLAFGFAAGRFSYMGPLDARAAEAGSAALGAALALAGLWLWLVRRESAAAEPD